MDPLNGMLIVGVAILVIFGGYGLWGKRRIEQLDREIEVDEAAARAAGLPAE